VGSRQVWVEKMSDGCEPSAVDVSKMIETISKPGRHEGPGMSLGVTRVLPRWGPAYRQHDLDLGSRSERVKACPEAATGVSGVAREVPGRQKP
jgi:hypothetical protein